MASSTGLSLLSGYSSGSSEDDSVPGPRVSTKRVLPNEWVSTNAKRTPLPLPTALKSLYLDKIDTSNPVDNPELHEGRIRSFGHERGNWTTYVYIPYEQDESLTLMVSQIISTCEERRIFLKPIKEPHISLTRTVVLRHHWIEPFVSSLRDCLTYFATFSLFIDSLAIYTNEEETRTFIGLELTETEEPLQLVTMFDKCLAEFRLPPFYKEPSFHLSIAWSAGNCSHELQEILPALKAICSEWQARESEHSQIDVDHLICKTGNKLFTFSLTNK